MRFDDTVGIFVCVLAVVGFYTLVCSLVKCLRQKPKMTVGVRVSSAEDVSELHEKLMIAKTSVASSVGFEASPVVLVDLADGEESIPYEFYIEHGDVDIFVKMKYPRKNLEI